MSSKGKSVEVRAAYDEDNVYFGYNPFPGNKALAKSVLNRKLYEPDPKKSFVNDDGSATLIFPLNNLGFNTRERLKNAQAFLNEQIIPQLADAIDEEVVSDAQFTRVSLPEGVKSLFTPVYDQAQLSKIT